jgi:hypothetical protein
MEVLYLENSADWRPPPPAMFSFDIFFLFPMLERQNNLPQSLSKANCNITPSITTNCNPSKNYISSPLLAFLTKINSLFLHQMRHYLLLTQLHSHCFDHFCTAQYFTLITSIFSSFFLFQIFFSFPFLIFSPNDTGPHPSSRRKGGQGVFSNIPYSTPAYG